MISNQRYKNISLPWQPDVNLLHPPLSPTIVRKDSAKLYLQLQSLGCSLESPICRWVTRQRLER